MKPLKPILSLLITLSLFISIVDARGHKGGKKLDRDRDNIPCESLCD